MFAQEKRQNYFKTSTPCPLSVSSGVLGATRVSSVKFVALYSINFNFELFKGFQKEYTTSLIFSEITRLKSKMNASSA